MFKNPLNSLQNLASPQLETQDPNPNVWEMFHDFDQRFFNGTLNNFGVELSWSSKMTSCAGLCCWRPREQHCFIRLSTPLLQLRSRADLVQTLIHEMIHAYLFVLRESDSRESHGPVFHQIMYRINAEANLKISVYHTFHDEVRHYQNHVWRCNGPCRDQSPYYGWVRRAMNRKPGPYDPWWSVHRQKCNGEFIKVSEPEKIEKNFKKAKIGIPAKKTTPSPSPSKTKSILDYFSLSTKSLPPTYAKIATLNDIENSSIFQPHFVSKDSQTTLSQEFNKSFVPFTGQGHVLSSTAVRSSLSSNSPLPNLVNKLSKKTLVDLTTPHSNSPVVINLDDTFEKSFSMFEVKRKRPNEEIPENSKGKKKSVQSRHPVCIFLD